MYRERVSFGTYFILAILIPAATEGQTPKDVRDGVVRVIASETALFGDLYLQVEAVPSYDVADALSANVRETRSTQRIRVGRRQRKRTCWDCEREWKRMVVPLEPGRPSEARQLLRTRR